ncbi:hypothetical protein ACLOJK_023742 [Asimina triloba]
MAKILAAESSKLDCLGIPQALPANWSCRETVNAASPRGSPCALGLRFSSRSQQAKAKRSSIARAGFLQQQQIGAMVVRDWG